MNTNRSNSVGSKTQLHPAEIARNFQAKHINKRSFSSPKFKEVIKQKIKNKEKERKIDLSKYRPVKLNFHSASPQTNLTRQALKNRILQKFKVTTLFQHN